MLRLKPCQTSNYADRSIARMADGVVVPVSALADKFHTEPYDTVRSSVARIKDSFWFYFSKSV